MNEQVPTNEDLIAIPAGGSLLEAQTNCAILRAAGIDAFVPAEHAAAIYPALSVPMAGQGFRVMVRAEDQDRAMQVLGQARARGDLEDTEQPMLQPSAPAFEETVADAYARRAARSSVLAWVVPPLALGILYCIVRALAARGADRPTDRDAFSKHLLIAVLLGIVPAVLVAMVLYRLFLN